MEHYKNPKNYGKIDNPTIETGGSNPLCGDSLYFQLKVDNNKVTDVAFEGAACAVSIASASMITDEIVGKTLDEARDITKEDLLEMIGSDLTTSRTKCATLVLDILNKALDEYEKNN